MVIKCFRAFFILCFFCFGISAAVFAQKVYAVSYRFERDSMTISSNQTFSNKLVIHNSLDREVQLKASAQETAALQGLINLPQVIVLKKNKERAFPLKYIADRRTIKSNKQLFTLSLRGINEEMNTQPSASFTTILQEENQFILTTEQGDYFLDQATNQVQIMVQALNSGLVPVSFQLQFSEVPAGLEYSGGIMLSTLAPGAQVSIPVTIRNIRKDRLADFEVTLRSIDETGKQLAARRIRVLSVGSVRRFGSANHLSGDAYNNSLALRYMSMNSNATTYQLQGNGDLALGKNSKLNYRVNMDYYAQLNGLNFYDTYLDYQDKSWGLKVGNIYENLDYPISGKGVQGTYLFNEDQRLRVFAVENDYMLFSHWSNRLPTERILAADYTVKALTRGESKFTYLQSKDDSRKTSSHQLTGKLPVLLTDHQQLYFEAGYSQLKMDDGPLKHALALGAAYNYQSALFQFNTTNYYSSPYYTGLRRGLLQSDSRLVRLFENGQNISARISVMSNNPKYVDAGPLYNYGIQSRMSVFELGYHLPIGLFNLDIKPYYMDQALENGLSWKAKSMRTITNLSYFSSNHRFSLSADYGYTFENTAGRPIAPFHSLRFNGNYNYRYFGLNSYIQVNPYYISDIYSSPVDRTDYTIYSFGPNTQFSTFKDQLNVQFAAMYNVYGFSGTKNLSMNGNLRWKLKRMWNLTADVFVSRMENNLYISNAIANRQVMVGLEKKFNMNKVNKGRKLDLTYFEDLNNNGIKDQDESWVAGLFVQIDNQTAITNGNGKVRFQNMSEGVYAVQIINSNGWTTDGTTSMMMNKDRKVQVPLIRTIILKGTIQLAEQRYEESKPSFSGIKINAVDEKGRTYYTMSDAEGNYALYLPPNQYSVFIETEGMPFSIENAANTVLLEEGRKTAHVLDFSYKDNRRKVDIKRF